MSTRIGQWMRSTYLSLRNLLAQFSVKQTMKYGITTIIFTVLISSNFVLAANADSLRYQSVWSSGTGSNLVTGPLSRSAFRDKGEELTSQGLRLIDVETDVVNGRRVYTGLWISGSGGNIFDGPKSLKSFNKAREQRRKEGLRLIDFEVFLNADGRKRFIGVWRSGTGQEKLTLPRNAKDFIDLGKKLTSEGLRLIDVEVERNNGELQYRGLWREGSGSNLFTTPRKLSDFQNLRDKMVNDGLELVDFERIEVNDKPRFVGVWAPGTGESRLSKPRNFDKYLSFGKDQTAKGRRTKDLEIYSVSPSQKPSGGENPGDTPISDNILPDPPAWIKLSGNPFLIVDFSRSIEGHPHITIPVDFLPEYLPTKKGTPVIPNNFCGFNIRKADAFFWQTNNNKVVTDFPYNSVENVASLGPNDFLGGIKFTGPIGKCANKSEPWQFFQPFTQTGGDSPMANLKLIIQMRQGSEIEFLNFNVTAGKPLEAYKIFDDKTLKKIKDFAKKFIESFNKDIGYCSVDQYVKKLCEDAKNGDAPLSSCFVGKDFSSPC